MMEYKEDYRTFIGKNADKYLTTFEKFTVNSADQFALTWHWPAFFIPFFWALYRKLYLWAFVALLLSSVGVKIPYVGFLVPNIIFGIAGNYIYYTRVKKKTLQIRQIYSSSDTQRTAELARAGGVSNLALTVLLIIPILGIIAAIAVPNLLTAIQRSKVSRTKAYMRAIGIALGSYKDDHDNYPIQPTEINFSNEILPSSYYAGAFQDGWENGFRYVSEHGTSYKLISYGKDRVEGKSSSVFDTDILFSEGEFLSP